MGMCKEKIKEKRMERGEERNKQRERGNRKGSGNNTARKWKRKRKTGEHTLQLGPNIRTIVLRSTSLRAELLMLTINK